MSSLKSLRAFQIFHVALAGGLLVMSLLPLVHALQELGDPGHAHLAFVLGLQALGAILLLIPRTVRWGGAALLAVLLPGFLNEVAHGDWELQYLIYATGVWLIMAHGAGWRRLPHGGEIGVRGA